MALFRYKRHVVGKLVVRRKQTYMKSILTSASVVAIGIVGVQAQETTLNSSKPWNVSAALRGFYDDNYATRPSSVARDSFGFEVAPRLSWNPQLEQTTIVLSYAYSLKYFEDRDDDPIDQMHEADLQVRHNFTPRLKLSLTESFVMAQEPEILAANVPTVPLRAEGDNMRNLATLTGNMELTEELELQAGYSNTIYDYDQEGPASYSAVLDRMEHLAPVSLRWRFQPETVGILGYQYGQTDYSRTDLVSTVPGSTLTGESRDTRSHYVFAGADHTFNPQLNGAIRGGAQFIDYVNAQPPAVEDDVAPYVDANMTWTYNPGSTMQAGIKYSRVATDVVGSNANDPTMDQQVTSFYTSINHRITPKVTGSLNGLFQNGAWQSGSADGLAEQLYMVGLNLSYEINTFLSAETGYSFDRLDSDDGNRSYSRNRVFVGIRGTY